MDVDIAVVLKVFLQPSLYVLCGISGAFLYVMLMVTKIEFPPAIYWSFLVLLSLGILHYITADDYAAREGRGDWIRLTGSALEKKIQSFLVDLLFAIMTLTVMAKARRKLRERRNTVKGSAT